MTAIIICLAITIALFTASFVAKRRFGLLGLALASGSLLSVIWEREAGLVAGVFGISASPLSMAIILALITVLPSFILLFHGYAYKSLIGRIVGAGLFTILALAFLIEPLGHVISVSGIGADLYNWILVSKESIIGVGLPLAIVDLFFTKPVQATRKYSKH